MGAASTAKRMDFCSYIEQGAGTGLLASVQLRCRHLWSAAATCWSAAGLPPSCRPPSSQNAALSVPNRPLCPGDVSVRYEADVPVSLSSVLSAALPWRKRHQHPPQPAHSASGSPATAAPIHRLSSSVGAMPQSALSTVASQMNTPRGLPPAGSQGTAVSPHSLATTASERALSPGASVVSPGGSALPASSSSYCMDVWDKADSSMHDSHVFDLGEPAGLCGWVGVNGAGLGRAGPMSWAELQGWAGLGWAGLGWADELGWAGPGFGVFPVAGWG